MSALIIVLPKILSENVRTNFPSTFCKRTSFQSAFFNVDEFSLGPVFIEPNDLINQLSDSKFCTARETAKPGNPKYSTYLMQVP